MVKDEQRFWHHDQLQLEYLQAYHVDYAYPKHSHEQFVICLIEYGVQSFFHKGSKYFTPPSGLILINPDVVHTGEAATESGFVLRSIYPTVEHMKTAVYQLTGTYKTPYFRDVRVDDLQATRSFYTLHETLKNETDPLRCESHFITTLAQLIKRYADIALVEKPLGKESHAIQQARHYIEANYAKGISLNKLADFVGFSPYHFLRVFHAEVGMPPHAYLQDVRIRRAKQLITAGHPLSDVAVGVGFNSQSHLTRRFKQAIGVTPGAYATQIHS